MTIGQRLAHMRGRSMTQRALARASGVDVGTISRIERGEMDDPRLSTLQRLAHGLGVTLTDLCADGPTADRETGSRSLAVVRAASAGLELSDELLALRVRVERLEQWRRTQEEPPREDPGLR